MILYTMNMSGRHVKDPDSSIVYRSIRIATRHVMKAQSGKAWRTECIITILAHASLQPLLKPHLNETARAFGNMYMACESCYVSRSLRCQRWCNQFWSSALGGVKLESTFLTARFMINSRINELIYCQFIVIQFL